MVHVPGCIYERCTTYEYEIRIPVPGTRERAGEREYPQSLENYHNHNPTNSTASIQTVHLLHIYISPYISIQEVTHFNNEHEFQYLWQIKVNSVFNEGLILSSSGTTEGSAKARRSCIVCREIEGEYCPARQAVSYCESFFTRGCSHGIMFC